MTDPKFAAMQAAHDAKLRAGPREEPEGCGGTPEKPGMVLGTHYMRGFWITERIRPCPGCHQCQPCTCQGEDTCPRHTPPDAPEPKEERWASGLRKT